MLKELKPALLMLLVFTILTGLVYPFVVTALGQALFPRQANGSLLEQGGKPVGSELIGQPFSSPIWMRNTVVCATGLTLRSSTSPPPLLMIVFRVRTQSDSSTVSVSITRRASERATMYRLSSLCTDPRSWRCCPL